MAARILLTTFDCRDAVAVSEPKTFKNRVHLDLVTDLSMADEVERLVAAGAKAIAMHKHPTEFNDPYEWTVLRDPEGNEFCVGRPLLPN